MYILFSDDGICLWNRLDLLTRNLSCIESCFIPKNGRKQKFNLMQKQIYLDWTAKDIKNRHALHYGSKKNIRIKMNMKFKIKSGQFETIEIVIIPILILG